MSLRLMQAGVLLGIAPVSYYLAQNWKCALSWSTLILVTRLRRAPVVSTFGPERRSPMQVIKEVAAGLLMLALLYPTLFFSANEKYARSILALCVMAVAEYFVYQFHPHGSWAFGYYANAALLPFGLAVIAHVVFELKEDEEKIADLRVGYDGQL